MAMMNEHNSDRAKPATSDSTAELRRELATLRARYAGGAFAVIWRVRELEVEIAWREHTERHRMGIG